MQHPVHGVGDITVDGFAAPFTVRSPVPDQLVLRSSDFLEGGGWNKNSAIRHPGIGRGHIEDGLLISADGHRVVATQWSLGPDVETVGRFNDGVKADLVLKLNRNGVQRVFQSIGKRHPAEILRPEILGAVPVPAARLVDEDVFRLDPAVDGGGVGKDLECGSRRAKRLGGAVELALVEVLAAHQNPHQAGAGFNRNHRSFGVVRSVLADHRKSFVLPVEIETGAHLEPTDFKLFLCDQLR